MIHSWLYCLCMYDTFCSSVWVVHEPPTDGSIYLRRIMLQQFSSSTWMMDMPHFILSRLPTVYSSSNCCCCSRGQRSDSYIHIIHMISYIQHTCTHSYLQHDITAGITYMRVSFERPPETQDNNLLGERKGVQVYITQQLYMSIRRVPVSVSVCCIWLSSRHQPFL